MTHNACPRCGFTTIAHDGTHTCPTTGADYARWWLDTSAERVTADVSAYGHIALRVSELSRVLARAFDQGRAHATPPAPADPDDDPDEIDYDLSGMTITLRRPEPACLKRNAPMVGTPHPGSYIAARELLLACLDEADAHTVNYRMAGATNPLDAADLFKAAHYIVSTWSPSSQVPPQR